MAGDSRLSARFGADTSDFKSGITQINREIKVLESGFRASASSLGDWSKDASGLESRINTLNGKISLQKEKVNALTVAYEQQVKANGKNSIESQNAVVKLNNETEALGKMQVELKTSETNLAGMGKESKNAGSDTDNLKKKEDSAKSSTDNFGKSIKSLGTMLSGMGKLAKGAATEIGKLAVSAGKLSLGMVTGVAGAAVAAATGLGALVLKTAATADDLDELSQKTGISVGQLQQLSYIGKQNGVDLDTMTGSLGRMIRNMDGAKKAGSPAALAFTQLGVKVRDSNGALRDSTTVWYESIDALGKVENETQRDALAMALFGKSAMEMNPIIEMGGKGMAAMAREAQNMGAVMSDTDIKAAADLNDTIDGLKSSVQGIAMTLASAFVPGVAAAAGQVKDWVRELVDVVTLFRSDPAAGAAKMATLIQTMLTSITGQLPAFLQTGLGIVQALLQGLIAALPSMLPIIIQVVTALVTFIQENLPVFIQAGVSLLTSLITGLASELPALFMLGPSLIEGLITAIATSLPLLLATGGQILLSILGAVIASIDRLLPVAVTILQNLVNFLTQNLPIMLPMVISLIKTLTGFIVQNLPMLTTAAVQIIMALVNAILPELPALITAAAQIIIILANGITQALPQLMPVIATVIPQIILALITALPLLITAALQLILALVQGLAVATPILTAAVPAIIQAFINAFIPLLPVILQTAWQILLTLGQGLADSTHLQPLIDAAVPAIEAFLNGIISQIWQLKDAGGQMIEGLRTGISGKWEEFKGWLHGLLMQLPEAVRKWMGISSPSKVFAEIGENMAAGLGVGFANQFNQVASQINGMMGSLGGVNLSVSGSAGRAGASAGGDNINMYFNDQGSAALGMAMVNERRRARLDASMGA